MIKKLILLLMISQTAWADTAIGRYLTVSDKPSVAQMDLLAQQIQVHFPQSVQTIGQAMNYLLRFSGYSLNPHHQPMLNIMLNKPLPAIDRTFGPMTLQDGLQTLAGPIFILIADPLNRWVDFRLKPTFRSLYLSKTTKELKQ